MIALVTYPYRDRETLAVHYVGEEVELTDERFAELSAGGFVDLPPAGPAAAAEPVEDDDAEDGNVVDDEPEQPVHEKPAPEMTVQQLRDAIEAANGFAPRKATKAELTAILETL
ncbi:hypothetical protein PMW71_04895 [Collinsella aerofaciens]|uniref:HeH/LEM domain-containing protein n=1 Tax=Collinsella aerofaciens TaxID=74426 RepID=A0AAW6AMA8_9ACTN|nr:hypothetical protein [Collinsella aerofaciens]MDB1835180.1 hypothetical protein [Collinsella aerofaciens]MDB1836808.1 hypothetical protein [Collinsella aerofaciens]MDB1838212.1 hypothetical protein [Collinsella aerofaciens]MDB1842681.1 hypothetical protein [Collinsella aerofaciens]MDB1850250.1 hypothetical protein [Collinsella aerofaciens]